MSNRTNCLSNLGSHALIIGGSMAGLLVGRVLADHFEQVSILEKDRFPEKPMLRKGTPQSQHFHSLLMRGLMIMEKLFPGLWDELVAAGAPMLEMGTDVAWWTSSGYWASHYQSNLHILTCTRSLLEWSIRRRLSAFTNITFIEECDVTGLLLNFDGTSVMGVSARFCNQSPGGNTKKEQFYADLVVDASGQSSKSHQWLTDLGYMPPDETVVNAFLGYASCIYEIPLGIQTNWKAVTIQASPPTCTRSGVLSPIEGNHWMISLCGAAPDYPPTDEAGFLEFASGLAIPEIYHVIKNAKRISPILSYRAPGNRWRHYERLSSQPECFIIVGDAVCIFSPIYAQGMTMASLGAITLNECLHEQYFYQHKDLVGLARRFQQKLSQIINVPWLAATSQDSRYPKIKGNMKTLGYANRLMQWYMDQVILLATQNSNVCLVLSEVIHMLKSPISLLKPSIFFQVLRQKPRFRDERRCTIAG